ncbi:MAG: hypothetical protein IPM17_08620 [Verrucomicrobia bacterium]|nr:hypothetical protein [Verrucomicrobiota bacterium]
MKIRVLFATATLGFSFGVKAGPGTIPLYENFGAITNVPQVDAVAFANYGQFVVVPGLVYETMNTRFYTNRGYMLAAPGFRFDFTDDSGRRRPAASFDNKSGATIAVQQDPFTGYPATLRIHATNIINRGTLSSDPSGLIEVTGQTVDLTRSVLSIDPTAGLTGFQIYDPVTPEYIYANDYGIEDMYWGMMEQLPRFQSSNLVTVYRDTVTGNAPAHCVTNNLPGRCLTQRFRLADPYSFVYTNQVTETNWIIQVALVGLEDTNITPSVALYPSVIESNYFNAVALQMATYLTNNTAQLNEFYGLYLVDRLASDTNYVLMSNVASGTGVPFRSGHYEFTRQTPLEYAFGGPTNAWFRTNLDQLIYRTRGETYTNVVTNFTSSGEPPVPAMEILTNIITPLGYAYNAVSNQYAALGAFVTNFVPTVPPTPQTPITNLQGRVEINAGTLNMERTRIRGEGHVTIRAENFLTSSNASIDVSSIYYTLGAPNRTLNLQSLTLPNVQRLSGNVYAWSAVWTNQMLIEVITNGVSISTNMEGDPPAPVVTNVPIVGTNTNVIEVGLHVMMVDATGLRARWPTFVNGLETRSTNVVIGDVLRVIEGLRVDAESLTILPSSQFLLGDPDNPQNRITDWKTFHFPNLRYLTNQGIISVPSLGYFGADSPVPYKRIVSHGTNVATALHFVTDEFEAGGYIATARLVELPDGRWVAVRRAGTIRMDAGVVKMQDGVVDSFYDLTLRANEVRIRNFTNQAGGRIELAVTNSFSDGGGDANVLFTSTQGIALTTKPAKGSLLGTRVEVRTTQGAAVDCVWAAEDRGARAAGFEDNAAVGRLLLSPALNGQIVFRGVGAKNAIYVDSLEFSATAQADFEGSLVVDPNFTIYYSVANVPAETLNARYGGRVQQVLDFAGPNSSVDVLVITDVNTMPPRQTTITVPRALRESATIDSDADGIANRFDTTPFQGPRLVNVSIRPGNPPAFLLSWRAAARTTYRVDFATSLNPRNWQELRQVTNSSDTIQTLTVEDPVPGDGRARYYRVSYLP